MLGLRHTRQIVCRNPNNVSKTDNKTGAVLCDQQKKQTNIGLNLILNDVYLLHKHASTFGCNKWDIRSSGFH